MTNKDNNRDAMTRSEAGQKGGEKTSQTHDKEFYEDIGEKGGEKTSQTHDKEFYEDIGQKGGEHNSKNNTQNNKR